MGITDNDLTLAAKIEVLLQKYDRMDILRTLMPKEHIVDGMDVVLDVAGTDEEVSEMLAKHFPGIVAKVLWLANPAAVSNPERSKSEVADPAAETKSLYETFDPDGRGIVYETIVKLWGDDEAERRLLDVVRQLASLPGVRTGRQLQVAGNVCAR